MNNHLKILIYIAMIVGIVWFVQDRYELFDIAWEDGISVNVKNENKDDERIQEEPYVEIELESGLKVKVDVEIADTDAKRSRGLSNRSFLGDYEGLLFTFQEDVNNPFWMKDMLIPLDIIFINSEGEIVDIKENQQPCLVDYCPTISSEYFYRYVLEVNANFCKENNIEVGDIVVQYLE